MKTITILILVFFLSSCSKATSTNQNSLLENDKITAEVFQDTVTQKEDYLLSQAKSLLAENRSIDSPHAKKCWDFEQKRPKVQTICLALWLNGDNKDKELSEIVAEKIKSDQDLAIIAIKRNKILADLNYNEIHAILENISDTPFWMQLRLLETWLKKHIGVSEDQRDFFQQVIQSKPLRLPTEYAIAFRILEQLNIDGFKNIVNMNCSPLLEGSARLRCWRILSTLVKEASPEQKKRFQVFLPQSKDPDWILFRRSFPHRARIIESELFR